MNSWDESSYQHNPHDIHTGRENRRQAVGEKLNKDKRAQLHLIYACHQQQ